MLVNNNQKSESFVKIETGPFLLAPGFGYIPLFGLSIPIEFKLSDLSKVRYSRFWAPP